MKWTTNRREFLQIAGGSLAAATALPGFAWAADGDTLRIRMDADFQVLDPWGEIGGLDEVIPRCTLVSLVRMSDIREGNTWELYAAEKLEWLDGTRIAFTLRDGLTWTKGFGPVTTADVKFSYERIAGSESAWAYQFEKLKEVEIVDDRNGIIHLTEPFAPFIVIALPYYGGHIVCKAAVEAAGGSYTTEMPAECGPYVFSAWEQAQKVTLVSNPDWTGERPAFSTVEVYIVGDDQAAQLAYEADAFDYTRITPSAVKQLRDNMPAGATMIEAASATYVWLTVNEMAEPLKDLRVRQAIQYAYDGDAVLQGAYDGLVSRSAGVIQPGPFAREANVIGTRDVEKARALLAEAGAEGIELNLYHLTDSVSQAIAQIIQASLAEAGITITLQPTEDAAYWSLGDKESGEGWKSIELVLQAYAGGIDPTENLVWFRPDQVGVWNWAGFDSPEFEDLYQKALVELDTDKRRAMFNRMEELMETSGDFVFICFEPLVAIHDANLKPVILSDGHPDPTRFAKI